MKTIISKKKLLEKLRKHNLIHNGVRFELSDYHRTPVGRAIVYKLEEDGLLEPTKSMSHWFEKEWRLKR